MNPAIGILGGTFDPVHYGHLRPAEETRLHLGLGELRLMPNHIPPHRPQPVASSAQRLAMLQLVLQEYPHFRVDDRELRYQRPSYTIDTLTALRAELPHTPLCFLIGMDSLLGLPSWHRWRELTDYAHLVVSLRPGWSPQLQGELAELVREHQTSDIARLHQQLAGCIYWMANQPVALSATALRRDLAAGRSVRDRVPAAVADYIDQQRIYCHSVI